MNSSISSEWTASPCVLIWVTWAGVLPMAERQSLSPCCHGIQLLWIAMCYILKVTVFRIKDFHFRMVQEVAQILMHIFPLLGFPWSQVLSCSSGQSRKPCRHHVSAQCPHAVPEQFSCQGVRRHSWGVHQGRARLNPHRATIKECWKRLNISHQTRVYKSMQKA